MPAHQGGSRCETAHQRRHNADRQAVPPAHLFQVFGAGGIAREEPLKLPQRPRKRQPRVLIDVHGISVGAFIPAAPFQAIASRASRIASGFGLLQTNTTLGVYASTGQARINRPKKDWLDFSNADDMDAWRSLSGRVPQKLAEVINRRTAKPNPFTRLAPLPRTDLSTISTELVSQGRYPEVRRDPCSASA